MCNNMFYGPNWIKIYGQEYHRSEYVVCGHQYDDLPKFGRIEDILVIIGTPLLSLGLYTILGINHPPCYAISNAHRPLLISLSDLAHPEPLCNIGDSNLYIAMRSHVTSSIE